MLRLSFTLFHAALLCSAGFLVGCNTMSKTPPRTVQSVDLDRYMGRWNVIANIPYFFERGKVATSDTYARRPDGKLTNNFTFRKGSFDAPEKTWEGVAWVTNTTTNAEWKVQLFWPFTSTYLILELDPDYRWAVVGTPGKSLVWILSRDRQMEETTYRDLVARVATHGYDSAKLEKVPQPAR